MTDARFQAAELLEPLTIFGFLVEPVTWLGNHTDRQFVRISDAPRATFLNALEVLATFEILGDAEAIAHYTAHLRRENMF